MNAVTLLRLRLRTTAPFAIGAAKDSAEIDLPVVVDAEGAPYVPATSVAGSLRTHLRQANADEALMGSRPESTTDYPAGGDEPMSLQPSALRILGTSLEVYDGNTWSVVTSGHVNGVVAQAQQTAIDRRRGAAATSSYRRSEHLIAGTEVEVFMRIDRKATAEELGLLASWQPVLGRNRTNGFGASELVGLWHGTLDLTQPAHLVRWLDGGGPTLHRSVATEPFEIADRPDVAYVIDQAFRIVDGLAVGGGEDNERTKRPVLRDPDNVPVITGSSLKGVLRSRCSFILRSLDIETCDTSSCGDCPICNLFGSSGQRGRVVVERARIANARTAIRTHVALDRFTGGASDRLLFTNEEVSNGTFCIRVRALSELPAWAEALLQWCIKDLDDGLIGVGGMTSRGLGTIRATAAAPVVQPPSLTGLDFSERGA